METYTKIDTLYKRFKNVGGCPNEKWRKWQNKIIMGCFSNETTKYLKDCLWEGYSKIDGTNSKICFFPSTGKIMVGGKTDKASSQHGQFEMLQEIADRIQPELVKMFPKETAIFVPIENKETNKIAYSRLSPFGKLDGFVIPKSTGEYVVSLEEVPVYIYGEYYGAGIQKCGSRYSDKNDFAVFDIKAQGWWVPKDVRDAWCKGLGLKQVPYIGIKTLSEFEEMVKNGFQTKVEGAKDSSLIEEGIVCRPTRPFRDVHGNRIIAKIKYCDYKEWVDTMNDFTEDEYNEFLDWYKNNIEAIEL